MKKRQFLTSAAGLAVGVLGGTFGNVQAANRKDNSPTVLTMVGDIERTNRGKANPLTDLFMINRGIQFDRGYEFSLDVLDSMKSVTINPTMEYDGRTHKLSGPRLIDVLNNVVGIKNKSSSTTIVMHGIDGYTPETSLSDIEKYNFILATRMDGELFSIGGFGPLFAIYDADRIKEFAKKPLKQRFSGCPWGLYCIRVKSA